MQRAIRGLTMKMKLTLLPAAVLLTGCSAFNTVQLYRDYTPYQVFLGDRQACVQESRQCISRSYANSYYDGESVDRLLPSRAVYLSCMSAKGYIPVTNGFVPPSPVKMTDYRPGWDCAGR